MGARPPERGACSMIWAALALLLALALALLLDL